MKQSIPFSFESVTLRKRGGDSQRSGILGDHLLANHVYRCTGAAHDQRNGTDRLRTVTKMLSGRLLLAGFLLVCMVMASFGQAPPFEWAVRAGGSGQDMGNSIATDANGNSYVAGSFRNTATFGGATLTSSGESDPFIAKLDSAGNFLWARRAGGNSYDGARSIAVDGSGNSYVTGYYMGTAVFGTTTLPSSGTQGSDLFITKLDGSGNFLWTLAAGSDGDDDSGNGISLDLNGDVYVTGNFHGSVSFGSTVLLSTGSYDAFIVKLDGDGNVLWATKAGGAEHDYGTAVATDAYGNSYVTGNFEGAATFGSQVLPGAGNSDIFIAKLDVAGTFLWAVRAGGSSIDYGSDIAVDADGNSYVTGTFQQTATFGDTSFALGWGEINAFIAKLDDSGNFMWAVRAGGGDALQQGNSIALDPAGDPHVAGTFAGAGIFGDLTLTSHGINDAFITKLGQDGTFLWVKSIWGAQDGNAEAYGIAMEVNGGAHVAGRFTDSATFGTVVLASSGGYDAFITKISGTDSTVGEDEASSGGHGIQVLPNPARDRIELVAHDLRSMELLITDAAGRPVVRTSATGTSTTVDISRFAPGIYLLKVRTGKGEVVKRFVKE
ncbi:MAG: SBBP repeat-containing protein [Flavobacteriales bacterium]|nr:SBBP repeat-containing protein [Flavobacteriales bacterium]